MARTLEKTVMMKRPLWFQTLPSARQRSSQKCWRNLHLNQSQSFEVPEPESEPEPEPEPEMPEFEPMDLIQPPTEEPEPEPETPEPEPEPEVEPVDDERLDAISEIEVRWSNQADAEKLLQPLERQPELVDRDGFTIEPTPKRYSGPVPVIHSEPQNMTSIL